MTTLNKPYTTVNKVKKECQIALSESNNDDWLKEVTNDASRFIEEYVGRDFWYHDHSSTALTIKSKWVVGSKIFIPWPIVTLTEISIDGVALDADDYAFETQDIKKGGSIIYRSGDVYWTADLDTLNSSGIDQSSLPPSHNPADMLIEALGTFGYTITSATEPPTDVPAGISRAATLVAAAMSGLNRKQFTPLDGSPIEFTEYRIPPEAKKLLDQYKVLVL